MSITSNKPPKRFNDLGHNDLLTILQRQKMEMCCTDERRKQCGHEKKKIDMQVCLITKEKLNEKSLKKVIAM